MKILAVAGLAAVAAALLGRCLAARSNTQMYRINQRLTAAGPPTCGSPAGQDAP